MIIRENVLISEMTTMRLGGEARFVIDIESEEDIVEAFDFANEKRLPIWFLGEGANSIGHDEGFPGVIIRNKIKGITMVDEKERIIKAYGGEVWDNVVKFTTFLGWSGIECLSMIPGSLGAAPVQNIGAYGQDISKVLVEVEVFDQLLGEFKVLKKSDLNMTYRKTIFNYGDTAGRYFIVSVTLKLNDKWLEPPFYTSLQKLIDENEIADFSPENIRELVMEIRSSKLPDPKTTASAGSFFKNVIVEEKDIKNLEEKSIPYYLNHDGTAKVNTGWLIENAGLSGKEFFGFRVSSKASLVLINESARSYSELELAVAEIRRVVKAKFGFEIETEPVEIENTSRFEKPVLLDPNDNCLGSLKK